MKKPLIVLIASTVLLLIMVLTQGKKGAQRTAQRLALPQLDTAGVSEIRLRKGTDTLKLTRTAQGFRIFPGDWPANAERINRFWNEISRLELRELISNSLERATIYGLDSANKSVLQITQTGKDGKTIVQNLEVGKTDQSFTGTFLREPGSSRVYKSPGGFWVDLGERSWKNTALWEFWADSTQSLQLTWNDSLGMERNLQANRNAAGAWVLGADTSAAQAGKVDEVIRRLRALEIDQWYASQPEITKPVILRVHLTMPGERVLELQASGEADDKLVLTHPGTGRWVGLHNWRLGSLRTALQEFQ